MVFILTDETHQIFEHKKTNEYGKTFVCIGGGDG